VRGLASQSSSSCFTVQHAGQQVGALVQEQAGGFRRGLAVGRGGHPGVRES